MKFRAATSGVLTGLLLSIGSLYPAIGLFAPVLVPEWTTPIRNELVHGLLLMLSVAIFLPTITFFGIVSAIRVKATHWHDGLEAGGWSGIVSGFFFFITIIYPLNALAWYRPLARFIPSVSSPHPPPNLISFYVNRVLATETLVNLLAITVLGMAFLGALQGAARAKYVERRANKSKPNLYQLLRDKRSPALWFEEDWVPLNIAFIVGLLVSAVVLFSITPILTIESAALVQLTQSFELVLHEGFDLPDVSQTLVLLSPLRDVALLLMPCIVIFLLKNPSNRFLNRMRTVWFAGYAIIMPITLLFMRQTFLFLGFIPYILFHLGAYLRDRPDLIDVMNPENVVLLQMLYLASQGVEATILLAFIAPWLYLIGFFVVGVISLGGLSVIYTIILGWTVPRPVDKAVTLSRKLKKEPEKLLPTVYNLFTESVEAHDILAHLTVQLWRRKLYDMAQLTAMLHSLGQMTDGHEVVLEETEVLLAVQDDWRWSADLRTVYQNFHKILQAKTLEQLLLLPPPPPQQTQSLPTLMVQSLQHFRQILQEMYKVNRVEDLASKVVFLENSLAGITAAQTFVNEQLNPDSEATLVAAAPPERNMMAAVLAHWQSLLLTSIKRMKGRADVTSQLSSKQVTYNDEILAIFEVANQGMTVAQQVSLRVLPSHEYDLKRESVVTIEILPAGERREIRMPLYPHHQGKRLRLAWEVRYDDAIDDDRLLSFADMVEFVTVDQPFTRIFPIPYVTGTPLKTDDVFVGREDVFSFIQENLVGAHQNNAIILHGQRRTGKTSVLYRLGQKMAATHYGVLIDMQGKPARGEADFLFSIADDIVFTLEDHEIEVDLPRRADFEEAPEFFFRSRFLRQLKPHLGEKKLLLLFDEFEELQTRVEDGRLQPEIFQFLRNLMQHEEAVDFVFSGTHKLEELGAEYWSILFNIAVYKPITFLSPKEVDYLLTVPVADYPIEYDPLARERIQVITAGHPYFTQLLLHEMIVYYNETERVYLTVADVEEVAERIVVRGEAHFKYIWAESSEEERLVLQGLAEGAINDRRVELEELSNFLQERGHNSADGWQKALAGLEGRDIVTRKDAKSRLYRFKVDLVRLWIERTRPPL
ncbi:MAG TPA: AAA family ATPase [Anaerolineae bacterium]|nr:AAA family ATPase [Anaerolineae bacterium]